MINTGCEWFALWLLAASAFAISPLLGRPLALAADAFRMCVVEPARRARGDVRRITTCREVR